MREKTKAKLKFGLEALLTIGALTADIFFGLYWWTVLPTIATSWFMFHFIWKDLEVRRKVPWVSVRFRLFGYLLAVTLISGTPLFIWGYSHGRRVETAMQFQKMERLEDEIRQEQKEQQVLRDDNDRLRDDRDSVARELAIKVDLLAAAEALQHAPAQPITDPDDQRNKFVCVTNIVPSWWGRGTHAILLEFGVSGIASEGFAVEVQMSGEFVKSDLYLDTPRMERPKAELLTVFEGPTKEFLGKTNVFRLSCASSNVSPSLSFYVYLEANAPIEPAITLYYTNPAKALGSPNEALRTGLAYEDCPE